MKGATGRSAAAKIKTRPARLDFHSGVEWLERTG